MNSTKKQSNQFLDNKSLPILYIVIIWTAIIVLGRFLAFILSFIENIPSLVPQIFFQLVGIIIVVYIIRNYNFKLNEEKLEYSILENDKNYTKWSLLRWLSFIGFLIAIGLLINLLIGGEQQTTTYDNLISSNVDAVLALVSAVVLAPVLEELLFRKIAITKFNNVGYSTTATLFLTSFIFSIVHLLTDILLSTPNFIISHLLSTFSIGMLLGYVYIKTRNIKYPIIIHGVNNFFAFIGLVIQYLFPVSDEDLDLMIEDPSAVSDEVTRNVLFFTSYIIIFILIIIVSIIYLLIQIIKKRKTWFPAFQNGLNDVMSILQSKNGWITILTGLLAFVFIPLILTVFILNLLNINGYIETQTLTIIGYLLVFGISYYLYIKIED